MPWVLVHQNSAEAVYDIKNISTLALRALQKNLPIEKQVAVMLKDIYDFSVSEIQVILNKSQGSVKYLLQEGRSIMTEIFNHRCALVNKNGVCHQCSELNAWFNPKQNQQQALMNIELNKQSDFVDRKRLFKIRAELVKAIDPLKSKGTNLQELLLKCNTMAMNK